MSFTPHFLISEHEQLLMIEEVITKFKFKSWCPACLFLFASTIQDLIIHLINYFSYRLTKFLADPLHPAKGPFSYSIEVDIDIFKKTWNSSSSSSSSVSSTIISLDKKNSANDMMNIRISGDISVNVSSIDANKQPPKSTVNAQPKGQNLHTGKKITPSAEVQINNSITVAPKGNFSGNASTVMLRRSRTLHSIRERYSNLKGKDQQKSNGRRSLLEVSVANVTIKDIANVKSEVEVKVEGYGGEGGYIYELREDILHPLVDSTNPRLNTVCYAKGDGKGNSGIPSWDIKSCEKVRARNYFSPSEYTIAVHMWTHTFLGWSYFRGMYNSGVYADVERRLVPNMECPAPFIEGEK